MLNQTGVTKVSGVTRKTILVDELNSTAFSCVVSNAGVTANSEGRKIIKAGTPLVGDLTNRNAPFAISGASVESYVKTTDTTITSSKDYYTRSDSKPYTYTKVESPQLSDIGTYYEKVTSTASNVVGLAHHDVDVTKGPSNSGVIVFGFIDVSKLDSDVVSMLTSDVKSKLNMIKFVK